MQPNNSQSTSGFSGLGIAPSLLEALVRLKYTVPTPIQKQAIPTAIQGKDVVGIAQTGTGKTLAFGIPMIQQLAQIKGQGLVVLPTRELALQVDESLRKLAGHLGLKTAVLIGGASMGPQLNAISRNPRVIVATPGRLIDHVQQRTIKLDNVHIVVLDEADRMLDMGFAPQIERIFREIPNNRQPMVFSATMPPEIMKMASSHMKLPIRIEVAPSGSTAEKVTQEIIVVRKDAKDKVLDKLLDQYTGPTLIFTRTKYAAKRIAFAIRTFGIPAAEIHSNRSLSQRREALDGFKAGKYRVLVATDIASRGIDVVGIELVINYDLPESPDDYVHRIGRTARAGAEGRAISLVTPDQRSDLFNIERLIKKNIPISQIPGMPTETFAPQSRYQPRRTGHYAPRREWRRPGGQLQDRRHFSHGRAPRSY